LSVTDDGPGVADPRLIFEPFYTTRSQGTGLGLAIVERVAREHGSEVRVDNVPGRGARFAVQLPVAEAASTE
jgi:two-component system, sensor histidine kinase FlrB